MSQSENKVLNTTRQIRFGGVGGQGIVLAGRLLGVAASIYDGKEAVCTQTYGPEARGGAARSDVVISEGPVDYPFVTEPDVLTVFFQEAYTRFRNTLKPGGTLIVDSELVQASGDDDADFCSIPATRIAKDLGSRLATNVVLLGCLIGKTDVVSRESVEAAIRANVKPRFIDMDMRALDAGIRFARGEGTS